MSQEKNEDKNIVDKAKEAAAGAKEKVTGGDGEAGVVDKAKEAATGAKEKVSGFVGEHEKQIHGAIEKTGEFVDHKVTRHRFTDKVHRARDGLKGAVSKISGRGGSGKKKSSGTQKSQTKQRSTKQPSAKDETAKGETAKKPDERQE